MINKTIRRNFKLDTSLEIKTSKDIFMLFLALNRAGYTEENNERGMHRVRKLAKTLLSKNNLNGTNTYFKKILEKVDPWYLIRELLKKRSVNTKKKTPAYYFISNLKKFSEEAPNKKIWKLLKTYHLRESKKLSHIFKNETKRMIKFINKPFFDLNKIVLIPNLLDAFWRGYGIKIKDTGYIVVGPGSEKNDGELIRHELLHILAPPYHIPAQLLSERKHCQLIKLGYIGKNILQREYVVLSLNLIYESEILKKNIKQKIIQEKKLFPYIGEVIDVVKKKRGRP